MKVRGTCVPNTLLIQYRARLTELALRSEECVFRKDRARLGESSHGPPSMRHVICPIYTLDIPLFFSILPIAWRCRRSASRHLCHFFSWFVGHANIVHVSSKVCPNRVGAHSSVAPTFEWKFKKELLGEGDFLGTCQELCFRGLQPLVCEPF